MDESYVETTQYSRPYMDSAPDSSAYLSPSSIMYNRQLHCMFIVSTYCQSTSKKGTVSRNGYFYVLNYFKINFMLNYFNRNQYGFLK
jgi:hypothetical protein